MTYSRGKWTKHRVLAGSSELASHLPNTRRMGNAGFWELLDRYGKVIVKPSAGSGGLGVMQVSSMGNDTFKVHYGSSRKTITGRDQTYSFVQRKMNGRPHIVQQKIQLGKVNGRPFDIRVMIQRKSKSDWTITGRLAKIAGSGYIITNIARSKGTVLPLTTAIHRSNINGASESEMLSQIDRIALKSAKRFHKYYPYIRTVGMDIALDIEGKVWVIEGNFTPSRGLFLHLKDKSAYRRIISYDRQFSGK